MKMEIGKPQSDGSVVVTLTPQGAITGHEFVKARGGTPYRLDTGGDGIFDPFQEDGKNSKPIEEMICGTESHQKEKM